LIIYDFQGFVIHLNHIYFYCLQVDAMLQELEKEIDDVDAQIGNRWQLLDRYVVSVFQVVLLYVVLYFV
jgi:hypothetical protein